MLLAGLEIPLWLALVVPSVLLLYLYITRTYNVFKDAGIPGPKPVPVFGTVFKVFDNTIPMVETDTNLFKEYGKFVGTFDGTLPVLMVYDADWLKEAFIKKFGIFTNRRPFKQGGVFDTGIFSIQGEHWKFNRKLLSPEFSSGKIKRMMPAIQRCDDVFVRILRESKGEPVDIRKRANLLTLDVISTTAFGIDSEAQTKTDCAYADNAFALTSGIESNTTRTEQFRINFIMIFNMISPSWLVILLGKFMNTGFLNSGAIDYFEQMCEAVLEARKKEAPSHDFLQNLADSIVEVSADDPDTAVDSDGHRWTKKGLTKQEVIGNALLFLLAGFRTTADSMLFLFYELAHNPEQQQKLYEEIMEVCDTEEVTIEQLSKLKYLDYCLNEAMRLYPQGFRFDRFAEEDVTIRGIKIAKGTAVTASVWVIHRDPEIWDNPEDFDPERFSPERFNDECSTAFMPFGMGNRQCVGNRLALVEMKMTMISTLKAFTIQKNGQTPPKPLKFKAVPGLISEATIMVSFVERDGEKQ